MRASTLTLVLGCGVLAVLGGASCDGSVIGGSAGSATNILPTGGSGGAISVGVADGAGGGIVSPPGTGGASAGCSSLQQQATWQKMDLDVVAPGHAALLNLAGLTQQDAEEVLCQGTMLSNMSGPGNLTEAWGDSQEVWLNYDATTGQAVGVTLWPGYTGTINFQSPDGADAYEISIAGGSSNGWMLKNGVTFPLHWSDMTLLDAEVDEIARGLAATFAPASLDPVGTSCFTSGKCADGAFGDAGFLTFKLLGLGIWVASVSAPPPVTSTVNRIDMFPM